MPDPPQDPPEARDGADGPPERAGEAGTGATEPQAAPPGADDAGKAALQRELELTKLRAQIAAQQEKVAQSRFGTADLKPPAGTIKAEDIEIEATTLAYEELRKVAALIATEVAALGPERVVLVHGDEVPAALEGYHAFSKQADVLRGLWEAVLPEPPAPEISVASAAAAGLAGVGLATRSVLQLLAFARSNTVIQGQKVDIDQSVLLVLVAGHLERRHGVDTTVPQLFPDLSVWEGATDAVWAEIEEIRKARQEALGRVGRLPDADPKKKPAQARTEELGTLHDAFEARLVEADADTKTTPLERLYTGAALRRALVGEAGEALAVQLSVAAAGGSTRARQFILWSRVDHSGGAVATYAAFDNAGRVRAADMVASHEGYVRIGTERRGELLNRASPPPSRPGTDPDDERRAP